MKPFNYKINFLINKYTNIPTAIFAYPPI